MSSTLTFAIMRNSNSTIMFLFLAILSLCQANSLACNQKDKQALIRFKEALTDPTKRLMSWSLTEDCCGWAGVRCDNVSGGVVELHLGNPFPFSYDPYAAKFNVRSALGGEISPALLELEHLNFLDLSLNDFGGALIPSFLGSTRSLTYLNLWGASFGGLIPHQLGNLSSLRHLDLGGGNSGLYVDNFSWISHLSSLEILYMSWVDLHRDAHWLDSLTPLSSLSALYLPNCRLNNMISSLGHANFTSLTVLYLPCNNFNHNLPNWLFNLSSLLSLDLSDNSLQGQIPSTISNLQSLNYLNISVNMLIGHIPESLAQLKHLKSISLFSNSLYGPIPSQMGNLSSVSYLHLNNNSLCGPIPSHLGNRSSLFALHLANNMLNGPIPYQLGNLLSLSYLYLYNNELSGPIPSQIGNASSMFALDLGNNKLNGPIPSQLGNLSSLSYLYLSNNELSGLIPSQLGNVSSLFALNLGNNKLTGPIPSQLGNLSSLSYLSLYSNDLNGTLPRNLGLLSNLVALYIGNNSIEGTVSEENFAKLSKLKKLEMGSTSVVFNVSRNWIPPFQLEYINLGYCKVGPRFPAWLQTQTSLQMLYLYHVGIVDETPHWFWKLASNIQVVYLAYNQISGDLSEVLLNSTITDLDFNRFTGQLPYLSPNVVSLNLVNNSLSGQISSFLCQKMNGRSKVATLDLSHNALSVELGHCLMRWQSLVHLNLGSNNLSGKIPKFIGSLFSLKALHLNNNSFTGGIPLSLKNCTSLGLIDFGANKLKGKIPSWIGERTQLMVLRLRSNELFGDIPQQICQLSSLIILDLADNRLSGSIPRCLNNFNAMATIPSPVNDTLNTLMDYSYFGYREYLSLDIKGRESQYCSILPLVRMVDLSCNNLSGGIPTEISSLFGLQSLNLSRNHLTGRIPNTIGGIKYLESLDLSHNFLSGEIPQSITSLTFLSLLNLSYNNLSGRIPSSTQLQSLNAFSFNGNSELCGAPLLKNCTENKGPQGDENVEGLERSWFYTGAATGFIVGFWGVCGSLLCKRAWRHAYFHFLDNIQDHFRGYRIIRCLRGCNRKRREERGR